MRIEKVAFKALRVALEDKAETRKVMIWFHRSSIANSQQKILLKLLK
jgi:hypothetical protein